MVGCVNAPGVFQGIKKVVSPVALKASLCSKASLVASKASLCSKVLKK
jgi:hypothetical protein